MGRKELPESFVTAEDEGVFFLFAIIRMPEGYRLKV